MFSCNSFTETTINLTSHDLNLGNCKRWNAEWNGIWNGTQNGIWNGETLKNMIKACCSTL